MNRFAAVVLLISSAAGASAQVKISEVMANPTALQGGQVGGEFVEIYNAGTAPVDLTTWKIADRESTDDLLPMDGVAAMILPPKAYAVILDPDHDRQADEPYLIPAGVLVLRPGNSAIGNGLAAKESLRLLNPEGQIADTFTAPTSARSGVSFERTRLSEPDSPSNWHFCTYPAGVSIGEANSPPKKNEPPIDPFPAEALDGTIVLNEVMYRPKNDAPEWIELHNLSETDITLFGWTIADSREQPATIPTLTIPKRGYAILTRNIADFRAAHPDTPEGVPVVELPLPALNDDGDTTTLRITPDRIADQMKYGDRPAERGQSLERRDPEIDALRLDNWLFCVDLKLSTPGRENSVRHATGDAPALEVSPNPFVPNENPLTLRFETPLDARVTLRVFDSAGALVRILLDDAPNGGRQTLIWDGKNDRGDASAPGVYIVQLLSVAADRPRATAAAVVLAER